MITLERKIELSKYIIRKAFEKFDKLAVTFTGGKDSTVMLYFVKSVCSEYGYKLPEIVFVNDGDVFPEVIFFIKSVERAWDIQVKQLCNYDVLKQVKEIGDVIEVSKLNERNRKELERIGFKGEKFVFEPESFLINYLMRVVPLKEYIEKNGIEGLFVAIRWDEQEARSYETFFSPRKNPKHVRIHPILHFTERDVWDAIFKLKLPYCKLYELGYRSIGSKSTTIKVSDKPAWEQDFKKIPERACRSKNLESNLKKLRELGFF